MPIPGVAVRSEFTLDYSLQLAIIICLHATMEKHDLPCVACHCDGIQLELMRTLLK